MTPVWNLVLFNQRTCLKKNEPYETFIIWTRGNYYTAQVAQVIFHKIEKQQNNCQKFLWYEKRGNRVKSSQETEDSLGI